MKNKYLELYFAWMEAGKIPEDPMGHTGLCNSFRNDEIFQLFIPTAEEKYGMLSGHWACYEHEYTGFEGSYRFKFNGIRQNIVLLMAAMNGEL